MKKLKIIKKMAKTNVAKDIFQKYNCSQNASNKVAWYLAGMKNDLRL